MAQNAEDFLLLRGTDYLLLRSNGDRLVLRRRGPGSPCATTGFVSSINARAGNTPSLVASASLVGSVVAYNGEVASINALHGSVPTVDGTSGIGEC